MPVTAPLTTNHNIGVFTVRGGQITSVRQYTDTQHVEHVLFGSQ